MLRWQFVLGDDWSSRLIAWWGQGYGGYSHVDAILPDGSLLGARSDWIECEWPDGRFEAIEPGVRIRPPRYEKWKKRAVVQLACSANQEAGWIDFLTHQVGDGYDKSDILGLIIGKPLRTSGNWICSALQLAAVYDVGRIQKTCIHPYQCPPNMLSAMLQAAGATYKVMP